MSRKANAFAEQRRSARVDLTGSRGRLPDFFVAGHPKSGTTALYEMLRRHPQIYMPELKEPQFFASDLRSRADGPAATLPQTLEAYLALFADADPQQRAGEASPLYLMSRTAARLIADVQPEAHIIVILREPASFVRSLHMQFLQNHVESEKDLRKAIAKEDLTMPGRHLSRKVAAPLPLRYTDRVRYVEQLNRYGEVFAQEQMLVLIYDDFRRDNEATVRRVLRFLDVDETVPIDVVEANPSVRMRSVKLDDALGKLIAHQGPLSRAVKNSVKALVPDTRRKGTITSLRRRLVYGAPPPPEHALMVELRNRYKHEVSALSEYLDRDLITLWNYDRLD
jgi:Sulfotransferase family